MPKLPGRETTFETHLLSDLLVGYYLGPVNAQFRCVNVACQRVFDGNEYAEAPMGRSGGSYWGARVVLADGPVEVTAGEICPTCSAELDALYSERDHDREQNLAEAAGWEPDDNR